LESLDRREKVVNRGRSQESTNIEIRNSKQIRKGKGQTTQTNPLKGFLISGGFLVLAFFGFRASDFEFAVEIGPILPLLRQAYDFPNTLLA
jgi:hypothetical protein